MSLSDVSYTALIKLSEVGVKRLFSKRFCAAIILKIIIKRFQRSKVNRTVHVIQKNVFCAVLIFKLN